jgi:glycosyltransferase
LKFSIITASYNSQEYIEYALESVAAQKYKNFQHIAVDGLSTDSTLNILEKSRVVDVLISEKDAGIYDALNKGIKIANGDVICFLHSDDYYAHSFVLEKVASIFEANPLIDAVYGDLEYVTKKNKHKIRHWKSSTFSSWKLYFGWMPPHPTLFVRRSWYKKVGYFDSRFRISSDYHNILKLFNCREFEAFYLPEILVKMRAGGESNRSLFNIFSKSCEDYKALRDCQFNILSSAFSIVSKNISKLPQFIF